MRRIILFLTSIVFALTSWAAKVAQAIWTEGNTTLTFTYAEPVSVGSTYGGQTVTNVWSGTAVTATVSPNYPIWYSVNSYITTVKFDPSFKNVKPTSCYYWFDECENLITITGLENLNTEDVTDMSGMFSNCSSLTSIDLSSFNTAKVTLMRWMFSDCSSLTYVNLDNFDTTNVIAMQEMFEKCSSLTSLNLSNFNTPNLKYMQWMFEGCSSLRNLDLSNFITTNVSDYGAVFSNIPEQCFIYMPANTLDVIKNLRSKNLVLKDGSAWTCANCEMTLDQEYKISYPFTAANLTVAGSPTTSHLLYRNGSYYSTVIGNSDVTIPAGTDKLILPRTQAIWTEGNTTLTFLYSSTAYKAGGTYNGQTITNVWYGADITATGTTTPAWNIAVKGAVTKVVFDASLKSNNVKPTSCYYWFNGCKNLTAIIGIANLNTSNVTNMGYMFNNCRSLTSLDLSSLNTSNVTNMGDMFAYCTSLTSLDLSTFNTANVTIMWYMFDSCSSLTSLNLKNFNTAKIKSMLCVFYGCSSLTSIDVSSFNTANVIDMHSMFYGCSSLTSLNLSNFNTEKLERMRYMFEGCISLKYIDFSQFNTTNIKDIYGEHGYKNMFTNVPAQCFVYMPANTMDEIKNLRSQNLVLKDGDTWTCANTVLEDGSTLMLPYGFTATGGVTYERSIPANTGNAYTVFLPYDCPMPEGVTAYTLRTDEQELMAEQKIVFEPVEDTMEAYTPYLIVNNGDEALTNLSTTVDTQVLPTSTAVNEKTFADLRFTGTVSTISNEDASTTGAYILQSDNSWKKVVTSSPSAYIPAYRAYIVSASSNANIWESLLDRETTSIESITSVPSPKDEGSYYTLDGRRVTNPQKGGIYIVNGRKFVWK